MKTKIALVSALSIGMFFAGRYSRPQKIIIKREFLTLKETKENLNEKRNNIVVKRKIVKPDGTIVYEKKIDHSLDLEKELMVRSEVIKFEDKQVEYFRPNWNARILYDIYPIPSNNFDYKKLSFGLDYRIFSNISLSGEISFDRKVKVGLGYSF